MQEKIGETKTGLKKISGRLKPSYQNYNRSRSRAMEEQGNCKQYGKGVSKKSFGHPDQIGREERLTCWL
jgi:hypothetical protein